MLTSVVAALNSKTDITLHTVINYVLRKINNTDTALRRDEFSNLCFVKYSSKMMEINAVDLNDI